MHYEVHSYRLFRAQCICSSLLDSPIILQAAAPVFNHQHSLVKLFITSSLLGVADDSTSDASATASEPAYIIVEGGGFSSCLHDHITAVGNTLPPQRQADFPQPPRNRGSFQPWHMCCDPGLMIVSKCNYVMAGKTCSWG